MEGPRPVVVCGCPVCRGQVAVVALDADAACARCGTALGLTGELAARLSDLVRLHREMATRRWETARSLRRRRRAYGRIGTLFGLGLAAVVVTAALVPVYLWRTGVVPEGSLGWLVPVCEFGTLFVVGVPLWLWQNGLPRRGRPADAPVVLDGPLTLGAVEVALARTAREARRVRLAHYAEPRQTYLVGTRRSAVGHPELGIGIPILAVLAAAAVVATSGVARTDASDDDITRLLWGMVIAGAAVVLLLRWRRRARQRRIWAAMAPIGSLLGGRPHRSNVDTVGWLNTHWVARTPDEDYFAGPYHVSAAGNRGGYDVMVELEPHGFSDENTTFPPRLVIYLAAVPADMSNVDSEAAPLLRSSIERAGFRVHLEPEAGLVARATPETVASVHADPSQLSLLEPVIADLVAFAATQGAAPVNAARHTTELET
jgi:hypothetical protein